MRFLFILLLLATSAESYSQISMLRYNDNFAHLRSDSLKRHGPEKLKYIRIARSANISFGGDLREQLQFYKNTNFGDAPTAHTGTVQLWHRLMLHSNLEVGSKTRLFAQIGSTFRFFNPDPLTPEIDENRLSLHQAFIDQHLHENWLLRIGRQEVSYGNNRVLTFREGPNTRLAFDAAIIKYHSAQRKVDVLAMMPVTSQEGVFDDKRSGELIIGFYGTELPHRNRPGLDYYVLNYTGNRRKYNFIGGAETRQTYGFRVFGKSKRLGYEVEGTYQSGKFNDQRIRAYSVAADLSSVLVANKLSLGLGGNYASGDKDRNDGELNTYNFLFSKPQYGLTAPVGATNIVNVNPYLIFTPSKHLIINLGVFFLWRQSTSDGTYSPLAREVRPSASQLFASGNKKIGTLFSVESSWIVTKNISLGADAGHFVAGEYTRETGKGRNISYYSVKMAYKF